MTINKYKRILLKLSGEVMSGKRGFGLDFETINTISKVIKELVDEQIEIAIVAGAGNIIRGIQASEGGGMDRINADYMGMLGTVINGLALQDSLRKVGLHTKVLSALNIDKMVTPYNSERAINNLEKGNVIILVAGTGNPLFTTDTTAALRAIEIKADVILKGTKVDGVYNADPMIYPDAIKYDTLTYQQALTEQLKIMDATAFSLCMEHNIPIIVFNMKDINNIKRVAMGEKLGTILKEEN